MAHIEIKNLSFAYPKSGGEKALEGINLSIEKGEYVVVMGKSGSGKTTLLNHFKTVLAPFGEKTGEVLLDGKSLGEIDQRVQAKEIGYVMQNPDAQIVTDKVWHELAFGLENLGVEQQTMRLRVAEMASYFGIQDWFERDVSELSGGQKQLLNLASIMAMGPSVLVLDEPTSQLDPIAASDFLNTIKKINRELGTTIIMTEHRLEDVLSACDRVVVMDCGKVLDFDAPRSIGRKLKESNNSLVKAMPSTMQIFYEIGGAGECPLTVREGRTWLDSLLNPCEVTNRRVKRSERVCAEETVLELKDIWFRYERDGKDVLKDLSLEVKKGEFFAIVGGNGTGKSTMLKAITGALKPYKGKIEVNGQRLEKYKQGKLFKSNLAMLPQDPESLFVKSTVREELEEMKPSKERLEEVIELCEISALLDHHPYDISGGEKQRVALAKVLLTDPRLLLLDEPTKGLDAIFKDRFAGLISRLNAAGITVLMVSHDIEFVAEHADRVALMFNGELVSVNNTRDFFAGNNFYTTASNRMSRHVFENAIVKDDVVDLVRANVK